MPHQRTREEIIDAFYTYSHIEGYIKDLQREREEIEMALLPRPGRSFVELSRGGETGDPTGKAAVNIADHPLLLEIDRQIDYYREQKEKVDQLLPLLTETELQIIKFCYFEGPPENQSEWPRMSGRELRQVRQQIIKKAARCWELINK